jgi:acetoacetyl-CoA synthetase
MIGAELLWQPTAEDIEQAALTRFMRWLASERGVEVDDYESLRQWSIDELEAFWSAVWDFFDLQSVEPPRRILDDRRMPGAKWFEGARLNYAEQILLRASRNAPALIVLDEDSPTREVGIEELTGRVGALAAALAERGVGAGDRGAAYLPNIEEAVVALLATTSLGAVWTACSPDFGTRSVIDRFGQVAPKVLIAVDGYRFNGKTYDRRDTVAALQEALPSLEQTILVRHLHPGDPASGLSGAAHYDELVARPAEPRFEAVEADHPLWILWSSGTTGLPKGIVQGHGGIVLEHLKGIGLDAGLKPGDRWFLHSSTSWMVWNWLVGALLHGATPVLFHGSPGHPDTGAIWRRAADVRATVLLVGSAYVAACQSADVTLDDLDLSALEVVNATGSPLADGGWRWLREQLGPRRRIESTCGGTDVCTAFFGGNSLLPMRVGEIAGRWLGVNAEAWDRNGRPVIDRPGEFVVRDPMPSMPLGFWGDEDGTRLRESYFDTWPGVWRQGDSITIAADGGVRVHGRSDAILNRGGVRLGTSEIYSVLNEIPEIEDALVTGVELADGAYYMPLFVVLSEDAVLDEALRSRIARSLREELSPRHVPDEVVAVPAVPRTLTGKLLEIPVKRILQGASVEQAASLGSIDHPEALRWFEDFSRLRTRVAAADASRRG